MRGNHSRNRTVYDFMEVVRQELFCRLSPIVFVTKKKNTFRKDVGVLKNWGLSPHFLLGLSVEGRTLVLWESCVFVVVRQEQGRYWVLCWDLSRAWGWQKQSYGCSDHHTMRQGKAMAVFLPAQADFTLVITTFSSNFSLFSYTA